VEALSPYKRYKKTLAGCSRDATKVNQSATFASGDPSFIALEAFVQSFSQFVQDDETDPGKEAVSSKETVVALFCIQDSMKGS